MFRALLESLLAPLRARFVDDLKAHLKRYSLWAITAFGIVQAAWLSLDPSVKAALPADLAAKIGLIIAGLGVVGALLKQGLSPSQFGLSDKETPDA